MKKILVSFLIAMSSTVSVNAATLVPNLMDQIAKQEQINTKNAHIMRLAEQANKRAEAQSKLLAIKNKKLGTSTTSITGTPSVPSIAMSISSTIPPSLQLAQPSNIPSPSGVDMYRVRSAWVGWYNGTRAGRVS